VNRPDLLEQRPVVLLAGGGTPIKCQHLHRQQAVRVETQIDRGDAQEAAKHEPGAGNQDHRERDLGDNQHLTASSRKRGSNLTPPRQHRSETHTRQPKRGYQSE
jgi:hypothetical protein